MVKVCADCERLKKEKRHLLKSCGQVLQYATERVLNDDALKDSVKELLEALKNLEKKK